MIQLDFGLGQILAIRKTPELTAWLDMQKALHPDLFARNETPTDDEPDDRYCPDCDEIMENEGRCLGVDTYYCIECNQEYEYICDQIESEADNE